MLCGILLLVLALDLDLVRENWCISFVGSGTISSLSESLQPSFKVLGAVLEATSLALVVLLAEANGERALHRLLLGCAVEFDLVALR